MITFRSCIFGSPRIFIKLYLCLFSIDNNCQRDFCTVVLIGLPWSDSRVLKDVWERGEGGAGAGAAHEAAGHLVGRVARPLPQRAGGKDHYQMAMAE
jgi:hypothetical protein